VFKQALVIGLGLIGGSCALALRDNKIAAHVIGYDPQAGAQALRLGLVSLVSAELSSACACSDLVILAIPPTSFDSVLAQLAAHLQPTALLVDVGSTKQPLVRQLDQMPASFAARCVPCHPIAGSEQSGPGAARATLFKGARLIVTPHSRNSPDAVQMAELLWAAMGSTTMQMTAQDHDMIFAQVSHLPHIVAFALAATLAAQPNAQRLLEQGGAGMRDTSRIAASDPALWADIALSNQAPLLQALQQYGDQLQKFIDALAAGRRNELEHLMQQAAQWRRQL
jgi:prephenate dehydrogenase